MKPTKRSHKIIAIFLVINFLQTFLPYNLLLANNNGPKSPEAATFEPIDSADMVNLISGDFSYVLPLLNVPSPEGGYPLSLSYHSGIAMGQESSWVGLGWNINPGAVNRTVSGIPDDWNNVRKYTSIYEQGGASSSYTGSVGVGYGNFGFGIYASYAENKTFGGENSYGFDAGAFGSIGINDQIGLNASIGLSGISASAGYKLGGGRSIGLSASKNFKNGSSSIGLSFAGGGYAYESTNLTTSVSGSLGINFNSKNGIGLTSSIGSQTLSGGNSINSSLSFRNDAFQVILPAISFGYSRSRYWLWEKDYSVFNGSIYAGDMNNTLTNNLFGWKVAFDGYEATYNVKKQNQLNNTNFLYVGYDKYNVTGQGISGSIQPKIFEEGSLMLQQDLISTTNSGSRAGGTVFYYPDSGLNGVFSNSLSNNSLHFYFANENSSFLKVDSDGWNTPSTTNNYSHILDFDTTNQLLNSVVTINNETHVGYNYSNKRQRTGSYIEVFTNEEIINELSGSNYIHFIEANGISRDSSFPSDGIGAYRITTTDGKTYHYSLPVYQKEVFSRISKLESVPENQFVEDAQFEPYATHWLLTAITGPDYVDTNYNFQVDEEDYGYWVEFEYGKWSDGFTWRNPTENFTYDESSITKQYQWGRKEIYYLDKVKTRTHTALFIKEKRTDNLATKIDISDGSGHVVYPDTNIQNFFKGTDGNWYFTGIFTDIAAPFPPTNYYPVSEHRYYVKTYDHASLKLSKIILLDNENLHSQISKSNSNQQNPILAGEIDMEEIVWIYTTSGSLYQTHQLPVHEVSWNGEFFGNVLDQGDIDAHAPLIETNAIKVIDFDQDYSLMPLSPNSTSPSLGRLTLKGVSTKGKGGTCLIPPYNFEYEIPNNPYDNDDKDNWGYSSSPVAWSLNKIITPLGEELNIEYEEDTFYSEAAESAFVFGGDRFMMKFTGTETGNKWVTFKNNSSNDPSENIDFTDFFEVGNSSRVNVQYIFDPSVSGEERVADVDKICTVTSVSSDNVVFQIPSSSTHGYERSGAACHEDNFVYYSWYANTSGGHEPVTERTQNFVEEWKPDDCYGVEPNTHRTRIQFYSNKKEFNKNGGGIRVKNLELVGENNDTYITSYSYNIPNTNDSSGITSFEPSLNPKEVKYITEMPSPGVMYEYVTVENKDSQNQTYSKDIYHFNVLKPVTYTSNGFDMEDIISLSTSQNIYEPSVSVDGQDTPVKVTKFNLIDNLSSLGRLISKTSYNVENQILEKTTNEYLSNNEINQGITKETFKAYKRINSVFFSNNPRYYLSSSSKTFYPNIVKSTTTLKGGYSFKTEYLKQDFLTGDFLETKTNDGFDREFKSVLIPAYEKYSSMGSKADVDTYSNMLSQEAVGYTLIKNNGNWTPIGVNVTTWNNTWTYRDFKGIETTPIGAHDKIWRKHQTYRWDGEIDSDGLFVDYDLSLDDEFDWSLTASSQQEPWEKTSEITRYDYFSLPLETMDINGNFGSTKRWDENTKVITSGNAGYNEMFSSGAEYEKTSNNIHYLANEVTHTGKQSRSKSHTGIYSNAANNTEKAFNVALKAGEHREGFYKLSVWVDNENYSKARIVHNNGSPISFNGERVFAGNWVQLNHTFEFTTGLEEVYLTSTDNDPAYFDDFRLHPIESSISSYVYNEYDELAFVLNSNNLASKYQYDDSGRLLKVYEEMLNTPTIFGGFKLASEYKYNYARECDYLSGGGTGFPFEGTILVGNAELVTCQTNPNWTCLGSACLKKMVSAINISGGSGSYVNFEWSYRPSNSSSFYEFDETTIPSTYFEWRSDDLIWCSENGTPLAEVTFKCIITDSDNNVGTIYIHNQSLGCSCQYTP
jgi:hypothetical protein